eukprot:scaffold16290_cov59-Isochrysis_galbana.AAC.1
MEEVRNRSSINTGNRDSPLPPYYGTSRYRSSFPFLNPLPPVSQARPTTLGTWQCACPLPPGIGSVPPRYRSTFPCIIHPLPVSPPPPLPVAGTTDCLGHVALLTEVMLQLGMHKPKLQRTVSAVFIANEENGAVAGI